MKEKSLLMAPLGILICGFGVLFLKGQTFAVPSYLHWLPTGGAWLAVLGIAAIVSLFLYYILHHIGLDTDIYVIILTLASIGLTEIARLKPELLVPQVCWLTAGLIVFFLVIRFWRPLRSLLNYPYLLGLACIVILGLPLLFGTEIGGSRNWLVLGPVSVQPSEFGKILIVFFLAAYLSSHRRVLTLPARKILFLRLPPLRFIAPLICIWSLAVLMFVVERDLGSALLFFGIAVLMTYMATGSKSYVFLALLFFGAAVVISYLAFGHVRVRFDIWLNPWQDPSGMAYQVVQSLFSFGTGGIWGTGFGYGHPGFIPEVHTDFIFAAIGEEWGLVGSLAILLCYVLLFWRGIQIALTRQGDSEALLAAGCASLVLLQAFIIIAGVIKFLPLTGITLPFISYGGSSMVSGFILLGLLVSLSRKERGRSNE